MHIHMVWKEQGSPPSTSEVPDAKAQESPTGKAKPHRMCLGKSSCVQWKHCNALDVVKTEKHHSFGHRVSKHLSQSSFTIAKSSHNWNQPLVFWVGLVCSIVCKLLYIQAFAKFYNIHKNQLYNHTSLGIWIFTQKDLSLMWASAI